MAANYGITTPFCGAVTKIHEVNNHTCKFTDMMIYKAA
jgi:hypothetical protein